jgi:hypothetical protein
VEWSVDDAARDGLCELVCQRAAFVADHMTEWLAPTCWRQGEFRFDTKGEGA